MTEVKEDNARLEARIQSLSKETSKLKAELREIADSSWELVQEPVHKLRFGIDLYQCPLPNQIAIKCTLVQSATAVGESEKRPP
ncbi:hypothetical protein ACROYT_G030358 [Oculina patagonica]